MNLFRKFAAVVVLASGAVLAQEGPRSQAGGSLQIELKDAKGKRVGRVSLEETPHGLLVSGKVEGLPAGEHAIHVHMVGKCEAPFTSAGDHFNPTSKQHGFRAAEGHHAGDLPNLVVPKGGRLEFEHLARGLSLQGEGSVLDEDGSALIVHAKKDDYKSQPSGDAGGRIACGVIAKK
jgi:superoxide dismutase, Cu-Zn family